MIEYVLDKLADHGEYASSQKEQALLEAGISRYLLENGIGEENACEYFKRYVDAHLQAIDAADWKAYFLHYDWISEVYQIAIEYRCDGRLPPDRKQTLIELIERLYSCGLGEKYIPCGEVKQILGN